MVLIVSSLLATSACVAAKKVAEIAVKQILLAIASEIVVEAGKEFLQDLVAPDPENTTPAVAITHSLANGDSASVRYTTKQVQSITIKKQQGGVRIVGNGCSYSVIVDPRSSATIEITSDENAQSACNEISDSISKDAPRNQQKTQPVQNVTMPATKSNGVQLTIKKPGKYRFRYKSGAYSVYAEGKAPPGQHPWLTTVYAYKGRQVQFSGRAPDDSKVLFWIADFGWSKTEKDALDAARSGSEFVVSLQTGDVITLVGVDNPKGYSDNLGSIELDVSIVQ